MRDNLRGILLMITSMAGFAMEDMFVKWAAVDLPPGQILLVLAVGGAPVFAALAWRQGKRLWSADVLLAPVVWRNTGEVVGTLGFITALALVPLSLAAAVVQAIPLAVTFGAAVFLGEQVGWRRWTAIAVGFLGVLIIIRPGMAGFDPQSLWAVLAVLGLAVRDLATRRVPPQVSSMQLSAWGFLSLIPLGAVMLAVTGGPVPMNAQHVGYLAGALGFSIAAYWSITAAMRVGEVSVTTPFRYSRLIFALIIGVVVFGETLDRWTLIGAALIIGSGLYTFARERRRSRATLASLPAAG
jgi:drug/metabolite transporter (DMT)-like permease